jgi:hypothetical protein
MRCSAKVPTTVRAPLNSASTKDRRGGLHFLAACCFDLDSSFFAYSSANDFLSALTIYCIQIIMAKSSEIRRCSRVKGMLVTITLHY